MSRVEQTVFSVCDFSSITSSISFRSGSLSERSRHRDPAHCWPAPTKSLSKDNLKTNFLRMLRSKKVGSNHCNEERGATCNNKRAHVELQRSSCPRAMTVQVPANAILSKVVVEGASKLWSACACQRAAGHWLLSAIS